tara:strand:+ start:165 stop:512 length:348 start_codon:yes stop_codon:yes gene_type:complete
MYNKPYPTNIRENNIMVTVLFYINLATDPSLNLSGRDMLSVVRLARDEFATTITPTTGTCFAATGEWDNVADLFAHLDESLYFNFWVLELNDESQQRRRWKSSVMGYSHKTKHSF